MAESTVDILIRVRDAASKQLKGIQTAVQGVTGNLVELDDVTLDDLDDEIESIDDGLDDAKESVDSFAESFGKVAALGTLVTAALFTAAKAAGEFQTQIAEISTLVDPAVQSNEQLRESVLGLSNEFGQDRAEIAAAMYQAISRGATAGAEANQLLRVSLDLARAGVVSVEDATNGLTSVLNAFNLEMSEAAAVSDSMFAAVRGGATTVGELSSFLFQAAPLASALGVSFQELNAGIAAITLSGTPTAQAATQIRAALQGLAKDTPAVNKALGGYADVSEAIEKVGLQGTLDLVAKATNGNVGELIKLVGSIEGVQAIMQLTGDTSGRFTEQLDAQNMSLGATAEAARKVEQSFGVQLEQTTVRLSNAFTGLGEAFTPVLVPFVSLLGDAAVAVSNLAEKSELFQGFVKVVGIFAAVGAAAVALVSALAVLSKITGFAGTVFVKTGARATAMGLSFGKASIGARVLGAAVRFMLGPIGIAITAISLLALGFSAMAASVDDAARAIDKSIKNIANLNSIERLELFETTTAQVITLTAKVNDQVAAVQRLIDKKKENNGLGFFDRGRLKTAQEEVAKTREELVAAGAQLELVGDSLNDIDIKLLSEDQIQELRDNLAAGEAKAKDLAAAFDEATAAANAFKPKQTNFKHEFGGGVEFIPEEASEVVTPDEQAGLDASQIEIEALRLANIERQKFIDSAEDIAKVRAELAADEAAAEKAAKAAADKRLTDAEKLAAAQEQAALNRAEGKGEDVAAKRVRDGIIAENDILTEELEAGFLSRAVTAENYYAGLATIAQENADAEIAVIEAQQERLKQVRADALAVADAGGKSEVAKAAIKADFDAQEAAIDAGIDRIKVRTAAGIRAIATDAAQASAAGIKIAIDTMLNDLKVGIANIEAKRQEGLISSSEAAGRIAALNEQINAQLEHQLDLLLALQAAGSTDPEVLAQLARVRDELGQTTELVGAFVQQLQTSTEGAFTEFFDTTLQSLDNVGEAFDGLIKSIGDSIRSLIAQQLANKLTEALFGKLFSKGSTIGGLFGSTGGVVAKQGGVVTAKQGGIVAAKSGGVVYAKSGGVVAEEEDRIVVLPAQRYTKAKSGGIMKLRAGGPSSVGGKVRGRGTATSDSVPAMLSKGEYVVRAKSVAQYGVQMLEAINQGVAEPLISQRRLTVRKATRKRKAFAQGGPVTVGSAPTAEVIYAALGGSVEGGQGGEGGGSSMKLEVSEGALNLTMRDFLEQEFGRVMSQR